MINVKVGNNKALLNVLVKMFQTLPFKSLVVYKEKTRICKQYLWV